jgi:membrane protein
VVGRPHTPGFRFELAMIVLKQLHTARSSAGHGLSLAALAEGLRADPLQLEPAVELLCELDWVSRLDEAGNARLVLLCDVVNTPLKPLLDRTLLAPGPASAAFRQHTGLDRMSLAQALAT